MKKIFLISLLSALIAAPAFATGIAKNVEEADCTQPVLGTTSGTSNLEASWEANTLNLRWYVDGEEYTAENESATECTYDSGITIPENEPEKEGYTFAGWHVVSASNENANNESTDEPNNEPEEVI